MSLSIMGTMDFPCLKSNMFVGENIEATEKYKEEKFKGSVGISTTKR